MKNMAKGIKAQRLAKGLTQEMAANACNLSVRAYGQLERCTGNASFRTFEKVIEGLGINAQDLLED